ncbi:MAG: putative sugar O-methyltransferase [Pseudorhodoplanes sp.]|nr:putative sugar O-methyltransferase [Pseudorhodoplanes sp.]
MTIVNRPDLLARMMADLEAYHGPLRPGDYWLRNQRASLAWLKAHDLNHFRRFVTEGKGLSNFGGGSLWPPQEQIAREMRKLSRSVIYRAAQKLGIGPITSRYARRIRSLATQSNRTINAATWLAELCQARDDMGILDRLEVGSEGEPEDIIIINGRKYTPTFLMKVLIYLDVVDLAGPLDLKHYVEIGPGAARLAEIVARLHPAARLYLVDIPPQLYVTHQVLQAIFPGEVASYDEIQSNPALLKSGPYRIFTLAPWQMESLTFECADLMVCEATEEIPKLALQSYLDFVRRVGTRHAFIRTTVSKQGYDIASVGDLQSWLPGYSLLRQVPVYDDNSPRLLDFDADGFAGNPAVALLFSRVET